MALIFTACPGEDEADPSQDGEGIESHDGAVDDAPGDSGSDSPIDASEDEGGVDDAAETAESDPIDQQDELPPDTDVPFDQRDSPDDTADVESAEVEDTRTDDTADVESAEVEDTRTDESDARPSDVCRDECEAGVPGCVGDGTQRWDCGENDDDICMDRILEECVNGSSCIRGICQGGELCEDECGVGTMGCTDTTQRFHCGEADDDPCLEVIRTMCGGENRCQPPGLCVPEGMGCGAISSECQGNLLVQCVDNLITTSDCAEFGLHCVYDDVARHYSCLNADGCLDECIPGWSACDVTGSRELSCVDADENGCFEWVFEDCAGGMTCSAGKCQSDAGCLDECRHWEIGCEEGLVRLFCGEGDDGDRCLDIVEAACDEGDFCFDGLCLPSGPTSCGDITLDGECQGNYLLYCFEDELYGFNCADDGMICTMMTVTGFHGCRLE